MDYGGGGRGKWTETSSDLGVELTRYGEVNVGHEREREPEEVLSGG